MSKCNPNELLAEILDDLTDAYEVEYLNALFDGIINLYLYQTMIYSDPPHNFEKLKRRNNIIVIERIIKHLKQNATENMLSGLKKVATHKGLLQKAVFEFIREENLNLSEENFFLYHGPFLFGTK